MYRHRMEHRVSGLVWKKLINNGIQYGIGIATVTVCVWSNSAIILRASTYRYYVKQKQGHDIKIAGMDTAAAPSSNVKLLL